MRACGVRLRLDRPPVGVVALSVAVLLTCAPTATHAAEPAIPIAPAAVSAAFDRDVMAVLSKAGCNAGTCHGNLHGKGGFFLSLRGQDPAADWREIVASSAGRRINRIAPERSLVLLKATAQVPHGGGRRFGPEDPEFEVLAHPRSRGSPSSRPTR